MPDLKTPEATAIKVRNAIKAFGLGEAVVRALDDGSLILRNGEFFTVLGPHRKAVEKRLGGERDLERFDDAGGGEPSHWFLGSMAKTTAPPGIFMNR